MKKVALIFMSILIAFNLILPPDVAQANIVSKPLAITAKKVAKDIVKDTAVEMANQIVSEYLVKELLEGVNTDKGYSAVCMDGKKDNIKDCAPDKRAQVKTDLSQTDKKNLEKKVESVLERKTLTSTRWGKFLDFFIPIFLVSGAIEFISSALDGDILSFFDEIAQESLVESGLLKPLVGVNIEPQELVDFSSVVASTKLSYEKTSYYNQRIYITTVNKPGAVYDVTFLPRGLNEITSTIRSGGTFILDVDSQSHQLSSNPVAFTENVYLSSFTPGVGSFYSLPYTGIHQGGIYDDSKVADAAGHVWISNNVISRFVDAQGDVNKLLNLYVAYIKSATSISFSVPTYTPKPEEVKTNYGKQTATDKIKDADGKVKMKGMNSFTFEYGDKEVYPSDQSTTGWKDKVTNEDTQVEEEEIVTEEVSDESGTEQGEDIDDIKDEIAKLDKNKVHHILQDKHDWHKVAKNSKDWDEIARIISKVLKEGKEGPYKSVHSKTLKIGENTIEVTYAKLKNGTIKVSDAWVRKASEQKVKNMMIKNNLNSKNMLLLKGEEIKMNNELKNNILDGVFKLAKDIANKMRLEDLESDLMEIAFETDNIATYFFIINMLNEDESAEIHAIGATILSTAFSHINGSYNLALNHMRKAMQLDPNNITYKEGMLLFYNIPEQLITRTEAIELAGEIIKINPENQHAKDILQ
ncbi:hypothetical protein C7Y47_23550 [Lysinibacillus sphaericus]|uniref:Bacterial toxin 35 domain-containing protein n=1 Tax=Lysinibacillus sphaericus TaxID=1421 RepID=A0A544U7P6_LYSSH|nr:polymorphic toxin type 35 domain-containing protein [Lysinibacillus sp. SDF0037]TQR27196.1 hypothetical protein C7Y47_23550 [Lysinibacillus sp. SDF0037]